MFSYREWGNFIWFLVSSTQLQSPKPVATMKIARHQILSNFSFNGCLPIDILATSLILPYIFSNLKMKSQMAGDVQPYDSETSDGKVSDMFSVLSWSW